jgi:hypothetical protein
MSWKMFAAQTVSVSVRLVTNRKRCGCKITKYPRKNAFGIWRNGVFRSIFAGKRRPGPVRQPGQAIRVAAMHPVAQGLPVHATGLRRQQPRKTIQHHRNGQNAPRLLGVSRPRRRRPQLRNTQILACNLDCRHAARSANQRCAASGHVRGRLGIRFSGGWHSVRPEPLFAKPAKT